MQTGKDIEAPVLFKIGASANGGAGREHRAPVIGTSTSIATHRTAAIEVEVHPKNEWRHRAA